jgi:hypothetical protein
MAPEYADAKAPRVYQLLVTLNDIDPPVWRRIQVSGNSTLYRLHLIIQDVMGWENYHLFEFRIGDFDYGEPDPGNDWYLVKNARRYKVGQLLPNTVKRFRYRYDLGDNWEHDILVEQVLRPVPGMRYPQILDGARACPPEDCGGPPGYDNLLEAICDPDNPEHAELLQWAGEDFDPETFDLEELKIWLPRLHGPEPARRS